MYSNYWKGYVMYNELPNRELTEIKSHNVNFMENDFHNISEVKKSLKHYELQIFEQG